MVSALLVIDVQQAICCGEYAAFDIDNVIARINSGNRIDHACLSIVSNDLFRSINANRFQDARECGINSLVRQFSRIGTRCRDFTDQLGMFGEMFHKFLKCTQRALTFSYSYSHVCLLNINVAVPATVIF